MSDDIQYIDSEVPIDDLSEDMIITSYSGFDPTYLSISTDLCRFIQHNFKNSKVVVMREKKSFNIPVADLQKGDSVVKIHTFPPNLKRLQIVNQKLINALKQRGVKQFEVKKKIHLTDDSKRELQKIIQLVNLTTKKPSRREARKQEILRETKNLVQKVNENVQTRRDAANSIEQLMDNARRGHYNFTEISQYVDSITQNSSADAMAAIANLKSSDQTYAHCIDVGVIYRSVYYKILQETGNVSVFESENQVILGAFLHDFGKSKVPKDILESPMRFERNSKEMAILRSHPEQGAKLLSAMQMPNYIVNMAHFHHVKQDTAMLSSYPASAKYEDVTFETRLLAIVDAYQALVGRRRYKRSWSPAATMRYIDALSGVEFDLSAWKFFLKSMGLYPKGSLVELNNKSVGFVVSVPDEGKDPERPAVAVVRNEYGEDLTHHELIDLEQELDISIIKDLDNLEVFGNNALEAFMSIAVA